MPGIYRLTDDIARRRILYSAPIPTVASIMVIDIPPDRRGADLSLGRYYAVLLEVDEEIAEMERWLAEPRRHPVPPNIFDRRPSRFSTNQIVVTQYEPPAAGWPWLSVCHWPTRDGVSDQVRTQTWREAVARWRCSKRRRRSPTIKTRCWRRSRMNAGSVST